MNNFIPYVLVVLTTITFTIFTISDENTIIDLEHKLHQQNNSIDSLKHEIDTLLWEQEMWDYNITNNTTHLLSAIMFVESSYDDLAYNAYEDAVGCLQIRKCMVDDVNRILKLKKLHKRFTYSDRWSRYKSIKMFNVYCGHYNLNTSEEIARCWNGGPRGMTNEITVGYWKKVENQLDI